MHERESEAFFMLVLPKIDEWTCSEIVPGELYLGSNAVGACEVLLQELKIRAVVSLLADRPNLPREQFELYFHPVHDHAKQRLNPWIEEASAFIDRARGEKKPVFVHCRMGISRSATLVIYYLMTRSRMTLREAYRTVRAKRNLICPNLGFMRQLLECEKKLRKFTTLTLKEYIVEQVHVLFPTLDASLVKDLYERLEEEDTDESKGRVMIDTLLLERGTAFKPRFGTSKYHPFE